jgi:hypothetical protein
MIEQTIIVPINLRFINHLVQKLDKVLLHTSLADADFKVNLLK